MLPIRYDGRGAVCLVKEEIRMITVFIEYKLADGKRNDYLDKIAAIKRETEARGGQGYRWYEGVEQPDLFVETFDVESMAQYEEIKAWRLADSSFAEHIAGGAAKLHIWAFRPLAAEVQE
jgi:hypothetical protein